MLVEKIILVLDAQKNAIDAYILEHSLLPSIQTAPPSSPHPTPKNARQCSQLFTLHFTLSTPAPPSNFLPFP